jgi:outer membrane usher protein
MRQVPRTAPRICAALLTICCAATALADDAGDTESAWHQSVLELSVNGAVAGDDFIVLQDAGGNLWLTEADFRRLRLYVPHVSAHLAGGNRYFPLAAIAGAKVSVDPARSAATITAPAKAFESTDVSLTGGPRPPLARSATGLFLNYELFGENGQYSGADVKSLYTELGSFSPLGVLTNTSVASDTQGMQSFVRLETTFTHDFPDVLETLRLGDAITVPGSWAEAVRFGGIQFGTNYGIRPDLVTTPLLAAAGTAVVPSTVDVFVNGKAVGSSSVPAGPFVVNQVPALTGSGDVNIVVRNALGQTQIVSVPFYSAAVMLQPGLSLWDVDLGALRENYGLASADYGPGAAAATWRHGFTATFTGEIHAEGVHDGPYAAGIDLAQTLDHWAIVTVDLAAGGQPANSPLLGSLGQTSSSGTYQALGIQHVDERLSVTLQGQHSSAGFRDIGDVGGVPPPTDRGIAQLGWNMGRPGSLQLAYVTQKNYDDTHQRAIGLTYQVNIGRGSFSANASRTNGDTRDTSVYLFYTLPLDNRHSSATSLRYDSQQQPGPNTALVETLQKNPPLGPGDGYVLSAGTDGSYNASYTRLTDSATVTVAAARYLDQSAEALTVNGGFTFMQGELRTTRTVTDSFAMVDVGGIADITVYFNNQPVARTDENGLALVPNLLSFQVNRLSIDPLQLPLETTVGDTQVLVVPPYRSGNLVEFPVKRVRSGVFRLKLPDGTLVPAGALVKFQGEEFPVGLDGLTYVTGYDHGTTGEADWGRGHCTFRLPPPPSGEPQPDLGTITCRSSP